MCTTAPVWSDIVSKQRLNSKNANNVTGTLRAFLSGKISYAFKWSGPSITLDTACSASSVAISQACSALLNKDCNSAIAGGVNVISSPDVGSHYDKASGLILSFLRCIIMGLSRAHFLSSTGQCKAYDETADGYCRSEGCGLFVLKRLEDALAENDRVYGVIRGVSINQCGNSNSITHPHSDTQASLFRTVLSKAGVEPSAVSVVEAHGTGTQVSFEILSAFLCLTNLSVLVVSFAHFVTKIIYSFG